MVFKIQVPVVRRLLRRLTLALRKRASVTVHAKFAVDHHVLAEGVQGQVKFLAWRPQVKLSRVPTRFTSDQRHINCCALAHCYSLLNYLFKLRMCTRTAPPHQPLMT